MKYSLFAFLLFLPATVLAHSSWKKSVSDAEIERVQVVKVHSGDTVTVRTQRKCLFGDDCVDGMKQFTVRLPYVAAPSKRQPFARESYLSLKALLLYRDVLLYTMDKTGDLIIGDLITCSFTFRYSFDIAEPCDIPEVSSNDVIDNQNGLIYLFRDGERFNDVKRVLKADYPAIQDYFKSRQKKRTSNQLLEKFTRSESASEFTELIVIMMFVTLEQAFEGKVHVDPKYTHFDSMLFTAQDQAKMLKKGIWSLPLSQQTPPWDL